MGVVKRAVQLDCVFGTRKERAALHTVKSLEIKALAMVAKFHIDEHFSHRNYFFFALDPRKIRRAAHHFRCMVDSLAIGAQLPIKGLLW